MALLVIIAAGLIALLALAGFAVVAFVVMAERGAPLPPPRRTVIPEPYPEGTLPDQR